SPGVYVTPSAVSAQSAALAVKVLVRNSGDARKAVEVRCRVLDAGGREAARIARTLEVDAGASIPVEVAATLSQPHLWSPADPHLYRVRAEIVSEGRVVDAVEQRAGLRDF